MSVVIHPKPEAFRDSLSTVDKRGKRVWLYPKLQKGKMYNRRHSLGYGFLALLIAGPFFNYDGHPVFLFNVLERTFVIFGVPFFPQDFFLFGLAMLSFIIFIALFTAVFGRIFCGWACPQTIFMEMVFRKIEYWIEGDASQKKRLDQQPWNTEKILKKSSKQVVFYLISVFFTNVFLAYVIGIDQLQKIVSEPLTQHFAGFAGMLAFAGVFFFVFSWMREQICTIVCPYGRLQGVLLDKDSINVSYDHVRGEPRGKVASKVATGDCVDCKLCVNVCPTGIDIRNGIQLECISCSACIDACDDIMTKLSRPTGLIRYASQNQIVAKKGFRFTPRIVAYLVVFAIMFSGVTYGVVTREAVEVTMLRTPGMLYQKQPDGTVSNLYSINLVNKTFHDQTVELRSQHRFGILKVMGESVVVPAAGLKDIMATIRFSPRQIEHNKTTLMLDVIANGKKIDEVETVFIGPVHYEE
ncbi:MAG TPA: cytochrome c oxidase accessory protein CcoG [Chitinophagales bacterium]|nr:cytochrome c oxidase accessory protein CcoG [Chitinophagales bacterium]